MKLNKLKNCYECQEGNHILHLAETRINPEIIVVDQGQRSYVWIGRVGVVNQVLTIVGPKTLQKMVKAIQKGLAS